MTIRWIEKIYYSLVYGYGKVNDFLPAEKAAEYEGSGHGRLDCGT